ncbi:hypothetical protein ACTL6U_16745 [Rhodovibrionaceae bacterium A322]
MTKGTLFMRPRYFRHRTSTAKALALLSLAALALTACGKVGPLRAPEGQESSYNYPKTYPAPQSVLPSAPVPEQSQEQREEEVEKATKYGTLKPRPDPYDPLSTTTKTYGPTE